MSTDASSSQAAFQTEATAKDKQKHSGRIIKLVPLPGGKLASVAQDSTVKIWRSADLAHLQTAPLPQPFSPNLLRQRCSKPKTAKQTAWPTDAAEVTLGGHPRLAVSTFDRSLVFFNLLQSEIGADCLGLAGKLHLTASIGPATCLGTLTNSNHGALSSENLVFGDQQGRVSVLRRLPPTMGAAAELSANADMCVLHSHHTASVTQLLAIPKTGDLLSSSLDGTVAGFDPKRNAVVAACALHAHALGSSPGISGVRCMALAGDQSSSTVLSGGAGRTAFLWNSRGDPGRPLGELPGHRGGVVSVAAAHLGGGHQAVTLSGAGQLTVWDLRTLQPLQRLGSENGQQQRWGDACPSVMALDAENGQLIAGNRAPVTWRWGNGGLTSIKSEGRPVENKKEERPILSLSGAVGEIEDKGGIAAASGEIIGRWQRPYSKLFLAEIPEDV